MSLPQGELYSRLLYRKGYGRAMWIPEPSTTLPQANRDAGICVGDVGLFRPEGSFDFLFSVRHDNGGDSVNFRGVPEAFQRQDIPQSNIAIYDPFFKKDDHIEIGVTKTVDLNASMGVQP